MNQLATVTPDDVGKIIDDTAGQFVSTLSQYQWNLLPDSQLHAAKQALSKNDFIMKIAKKHPESVHSALVQSAILGLDLTEGKRQGWLLPRKNQQGDMVIQLQVGYKGVEAIHQRIGVIDRLVVRVVHENDNFEWSGDDAEKPKHEANWFATDVQRGPISGAFAITYYPDGSINTVVKSISEIYEKHRDVSDSWKSYQAKIREGKSAFPPPWVSHEKAMIEKTMAYVASKQWPANIRDEGVSSKIMETLHQVDVADYTDRYTPDQKKAFDEIFEKRDALGMYLFSHRVDVESYVALFGTFPKGKKTEYKSIVRNMETTGGELMQDVYEAIDVKDSMKLAETLEDCLDITQKMARSMLKDDEKKVFDELLHEHENNQT